MIDPDADEVADAELEEKPEDCVCDWDWLDDWLADWDDDWACDESWAYARLAITMKRAKMAGRIVKERMSTREASAGRYVCLTTE